VAAALCGIAFYFHKEAMTHRGVFTFIAGRGTLAALALTPLALLEHRRKAEPFSSAAWRIAGVGELAFLVAAGLHQEAITTATVTNTGSLTALYVVFTPLVAWGVTRSVPTPFVWPAIAQ
jgi:drug/metabolite transporter (DMT)-like permease